MLGNAVLTPEADGSYKIERPYYTETAASYTSTYTFSFSHENMESTKVSANKYTYDVTVPEGATAVAGAEEYRAVAKGDILKSDSFTVNYKTPLGEYVYKCTLNGKEATVKFVVVDKETSFDFAKGTKALGAMSKTQAYIVNKTSEVAAYSKFVTSDGWVAAGADGSYTIVKPLESDDKAPKSFEFYIGGEYFHVDDVEKENQNKFSVNIEGPDGATKFKVRTGQTQTPISEYKGTFDETLKAKKISFNYDSATLPGQYKINCVVEEKNGKTFTKTLVVNVVEPTSSLVLLAEGKATKAAPKYDDEAANLVADYVGESYVYTKDADGTYVIEKPRTSEQETKTFILNATVSNYESGKIQVAADKSKSYESNDEDSANMKINKELVSFTKSASGPMIIVGDSLSIEKEDYSGKEDVKTINNVSTYVGLELGQVAPADYDITDRVARKATEVAPEYVAYESATNAIYFGNAFEFPVTYATVAGDYTFTMQVGELSQTVKVKVVEPSAKLTFNMDGIFSDNSASAPTTYANDYLVYNAAGTQSGDMVTKDADGSYHITCLSSKAGKCGYQANFNLGISNVALPTLKTMTYKLDVVTPITTSSTNGVAVVAQKEKATDTITSSQMEKFIYNADEIVGPNSDNTDTKFDITNVGTYTIKFTLGGLSKELTIVAESPASLTPSKVTVKKVELPVFDGHYMISSSQGETVVDVAVTGANIPAGAYYTVDGQPGTTAYVEGTPISLHFASGDFGFFTRTISLFDADKNPIGEPLELSFFRDDHISSEDNALGAAVANYIYAYNTGSTDPAETSGLKDLNGAAGYYRFSFGSKATPMTNLAVSQKAAGDGMFFPIDATTGLAGTARVITTDDKFDSKAVVVYAPLTAYAVGDVVVLQSSGKLYKCTTAVAATEGLFDGTKWAEMKLESEPRISGYVAYWGNEYGILEAYRNVELFNVKATYTSHTIVDANDGVEGGTDAGTYTNYTLDDWYYEMPSNVVKPDGATHIYVYAYNNAGQINTIGGGSAVDTVKVGSYTNDYGVYKLAIKDFIAPEAVTDIRFLDNSNTANTINGNLTFNGSANKLAITKANADLSITYSLYWGSAAGTYLLNTDGEKQPIGDPLTATSATRETIAISNAEIPTKATHILVVATNGTQSSVASYAINNIDGAADTTTGITSITLTDSDSVKGQLGGNLVVTAGAGKYRLFFTDGTTPIGDAIATIEVPASGTYTLALPKGTVIPAEATKICAQKYDGTAKHWLGFDTTQVLTIVDAQPEGSALTTAVTQITDPSTPFAAADSNLVDGTIKTVLSFTGVANATGYNVYLAKGEWTSGTAIDTSALTKYNSVLLGSVTESGKSVSYKDQTLADNYAITTDIYGTKAAATHIIIVAKDAKGESSKALPVTIIADADVANLVPTKATVAFEANASGAYDYNSYKGLVDGKVKLSAAVAHGSSAETLPEYNTALNPTTALKDLPKIKYSIVLSNGTPSKDIVVASPTEAALLAGYEVKDVLLPTGYKFYLRAANDFGYTDVEIKASAASLTDIKTAGAKRGY